MLTSGQPARSHTGTLAATAIRLQEVHAINPTRVAAAMKTAAENAGFAVSGRSLPILEASRVTITLAPRTIDNVTYIHRLICTFNLDADTVTIDVSSVGYVVVGGRPTDVNLPERVPRDVFTAIVAALGSKA